MEKKISVIVPVYKVEKYLERCIESILNQTYKNLEIILVDDGSPDKCGEICDEYAKKDKRIKVLHKENGGLSSARNEGIKVATGEFVTFVDSDDYLNKDMYKILYENIENTQSDVSACNLFYEYEDENNRIEKVNKDDLKKEYNNIDAIKELLKNERIYNYAWNKLYKKELFENIKYPEGKKMEDLGTTYLLFEKSKKIVYDSTALYYYVQRGGSIVSSAGEKFYLDLLELLIERYRYLREKYETLRKELDYNFVFNILVISRGLDVDKIKEANAIIRDTIESPKNKEWKKMMNFKEKIKYFLYKNFNSVYKKIFK